MVEGPAGTVRPAEAGLELSRRGIEVTAWGPNPDGSGTLLRLWELAGQDGECQVRLPRGLSATQAQPVDLRGRPIGKPLAVEGGRFNLPLRAFAPVTLVFPP